LVTRLDPLNRVFGQPHSAQLSTRSDAELPEDVRKVETDRPGAQEQLSGDLAVAQSLRDQPRDLEFL